MRILRRETAINPNTQRTVRCSVLCSLVVGSACCTVEQWPQNRASLLHTICHQSQAGGPDCMIKSHTYEQHEQTAASHSSSTQKPGSAGNPGLLAEMQTCKSC